MFLDVSDIPGSLKSALVQSSLSPSNLPHLRILKAAHQQVRNADNAAAANQALVSALIEAIPNDAVKSRITNQVMNRTPARPRLLGQVLGRSLINEWRDEIQAVFPSPAAIDAEVAKKISTATAAKRDQQKSQLTTRQGRRLIGVQIVLRSDEQFKELAAVYFWLSGGLQAKGTARGQLATPQDETRTDETESKAKSAD